MMSTRKRRVEVSDQLARRTLLEVVTDEHPNWPAQVELVRQRLAAVAAELEAADTLYENSIYTDHRAYRLTAVEFMTSSYRVRKTWSGNRRIRIYSERLINGHLSDLRVNTPMANGVPEILGVGRAILDAVERGHTVILRPFAHSEQPVVIRRAVLDMRRGVLSVAEQPGTDTPLTELNLYQYHGAQVLD